MGIEGALLAKLDEIADAEDGAKPQSSKRLADIHRELLHGKLGRRYLELLEKMDDKSVQDDMREVSRLLQQAGTGR